MKDTDTQNHREMQLDIHEFIQGKLDEGASPPALASMLVFHANKLGFDIDVDPRWVLLNSLQAMVSSLEVQMDEDIIDGDAEDKKSIQEFDGDNVIDINSHRTLH